MRIQPRKTYAYSRRHSVANQFTKGFVKIFRRDPNWGNLSDVVRMPGKEGFMRLSEKSIKGYEVSSNIQGTIDASRGLTIRANLLLTPERLVSNPQIVLNEIIDGLNRLLPKGLPEQYVLQPMQAFQASEPFLQSPAQDRENDLFLQSEVIIVTVSRSPQSDEHKRLLLSVVRSCKAGVDALFA